PRLHNRSIGDRPVLRGAGRVGYLDTDGSCVDVGVGGVPRRIAVPHELADTSTGFHLVVRASLPGLPDLPDLVNGQDACVVVDHHHVDLVTCAPGGEVLVHQLHHVGVQLVPVLHQSSLVWATPHAIEPTSRSRRERRSPPPVFTGPT